jgi:hypothetical protein
VPPCVKVPGSSQVPKGRGSQIPAGLVVGLAPATLEFWPKTLGLIPKREEPGKTGRHPVLKYRVPHGSHPVFTSAMMMMMMMSFICSYRNKILPGAELHIYLEEGRYQLFDSTLLYEAQRQTPTRVVNALACVPDDVFSPMRLVQ